MSDTITAKDQTTRFHTQAGMAFTCHNEGVCCNVFDTIPVDAGAAAALANNDHAILNAAAGNAPDTPVSVPDPASPGSEKLGRKACGSCTMLTPDNLCAIHATAGFAAKPQACQDFPYRYINTPGGVYVGLSFVCPTVRANKGRPLAQQSDDLAAHYPRAASIRNSPGTIPLNARVNLTWDDYLLLETALVEILAIASEPLPTRLIALCLVPGFIDQMLAQAGPGQVSITQVITAIQANNYQHVLRLARKQTRSNPRSRRMFLGMYTSFANTLHRRQGQGRLVTVAGVMNQYMRHAIGQGHITLQPVATRLTSEQLDRARLPDTGESAQEITRYLSHCIFRKDLTLSGDITRRLRLLALNAALIPWYATALAAEEAELSGDTAVAPTDKHWDEAIGHIERLYGYHSTFHQFFENNKAFADIVDSFILKPAYPFTLFR